MIGRRNKRDNRIQLIINLDGLIIPEYAAHAYEYYKHPYYYKFLPERWGKHHIKNSIKILYEGKFYYYMLVPGMLELLQYYLIKMKNVVCVSVFSTGPVARNNRIAEGIKFKVAERAGINPADVSLPVYSIDEYATINEATALHPQSRGHTNISVRRCVKKMMSSTLNVNMDNVIVIDNKVEDTAFDETDQHLKVPTCYIFSGNDFLKYRGTLMQEANPLKMNMRYFREDAFYRNNLVFYIIGIMAEAMIYARENNTSVSQSLTLLQTSLDSKKYKALCDQKHIYDRYDVGYYFKGYSILSKLYPKLQLFIPYPALSMESLQLICEKRNSLVKYALIANTGQYWPPNIYDRISQYCTEYPVDVSAAQQGIFSNTKSNDVRKIDNDIMRVVEAESSNRKSTGCVVS